MNQKKNPRFRMGSFFDYCVFSQNCNYEAITNYLIFEPVGKVSIYMDRLMGCS